MANDLSDDRPANRYVRDPLPRREFPDGGMPARDAYELIHLGLKVDGVLKGDISLDTGGTVHVGATGAVEGTTIEADNVLIEGKVRGTEIARKTLELTGSATLLGYALYDALIDLHPRERLRGKIELRGVIDAQSE